jgi:aspartyl aminopeptidase
MHGVFIDENGKKIKISIGEEPGDPVFTVTDLLPHLAQEQMERKGSEVVEGENLDILAGSRPYNDKSIKEKVKLGVLSFLHEKYGITEKDFARAEIEFVPAFKARDIGFDRSLIGSYGHDDKCCTYPAIKALTEIAAEKITPNKTLVLYLSDKEETGSAGNTGAQSQAFHDFLTLLCEDNVEKLRLCCYNSSMLSTDVNAAFDPAYQGVFDKRNSSYIGKGMIISKYSGSRGKVGASDANAEFGAKVQGIMNRNGIQWQFGALGKVDKGGSVKRIKVCTKCLRAGKVNKVV